MLKIFYKQEIFLGIRTLFEWFIMHVMLCGNSISLIKMLMKYVIVWIMTDVIAQNKVDVYNRLPCAISLKQNVTSNLNEVDVIRFCSSFIIQTIE